MVVVVLVIAACGETRQVTRWPAHRRQEDERMRVLEQKAADLEARLRRLEIQVQRVPAAPAVPAPPPNPPDLAPPAGRD